MKNIIITMSIMLAGLLLVSGCQNSSLSGKTAFKDTLVKEVGGDLKVCSQCGQIKGTKACCNKDAATCSKCGLQKGSPLCCNKTVNLSKGDIDLCEKCGQPKGSAQCCKPGAKICIKCGFQQGSLGCQLADEYMSMMY